MEAKNIDSILIPREQAMSVKENIPNDPVIEEQENISEAPKIEQEIAESTQEPVENSQSLENKEPPENKATDEKTNDSPIDEYGNPLEKPKMYSEEEVQRMIRDRLSRGRHAEQPQSTQQQIQREMQDFKADPESEESWEVQLNRAIDHRIETRQKEITEKQWQQQEIAKQADFEAKFTSGMDRYSDFRQVVSGKPITDSMMLATRSLENPAAFIYGAAKLHPQELDRISRIADPYAQASEIGRLHERMIKERKSASNSPRPLETPKGDLPAKSNNMPSLEDRIHQYAKSKRK